MFKKNYRNLFIYTYLVSIIIFLICVGYIFDITNKSDVSKISIENLKSKMYEREDFLNSYLNTYKKALLSLSEDDTFKKYLLDETLENEVNNEFITLIKIFDSVSRIRYIDTIGFEKIRIEKTLDNKYYIAEDFQDKSNSEYFKQFINLKKREIGFSKIDIRKEFGKVVEPKELVLRIATPVYDYLDVKQGFIVFSIHLNKFLNSFNKSTLYNLHLIDDNGRYIYHNSHNKSLDSYVSSNETIFSEFGKKIASKVLNNDEYSGANFYSKKIKGLDDNLSLILLLDLKYENLTQEKNDNQLIFFVTILLLAFALLPFIINFAKKTDQLEEKMKRISNIDQLTDLPNRIQLFTDLKKNRFEKSIIILVYVDNYNKLKSVYGFDIIQMALKKFADSLINNKNLQDVLKVYSVGKNIFALKYYYTSSEKLESFLKDIHIFYEKKRFYILEDIDITFDLTLATSNPLKLNNNIDELKEAELALEHALDTKDDIFIYNDSLENKIHINRKNIEMVRVIKKAIENNGVIVYFQPIYNNYKDKIEKFESLVRLKVDGKLYFPNEFLPISKDIKKYKTITKMVIDKSFEFFEDKNFEFSINLTMEDVSCTEIKNYLFEKIKNSKKPQNLVIEIVESESIKNYREFIKFIIKVKSLGCKIAIDDFGSGYSNFEYIIKLNRYIDYLKIDGSLVKGVEHNKKNQLIIGTIKFLCDNLGIKTIVEYVENKESFDFIKSMNIDFSQGYFIGEPKEFLITKKNNVLPFIA